MELSQNVTMIVPAIVVKRPALRFGFDVSPEANPIRV